MSERFLFRFGLAVSVAFALIFPVRAEEMVTISKSRLEELERKEKELNALKGDLGKAREEQRRLEREKKEAEDARAKAEAEWARAESEKQRKAPAKEAAEVRAAGKKPEAVITHDTPALSSLPPLKKGDVVDAKDLMNHYRADAAAAEQRYGKKRLRVRGVVAGFEKTPFMSFYTILLQTTEPSWRVVCHVDPPPEFKATYKGQHGDALVGVTKSDARITLLRVGQTVEIESNCKGQKDQSVLLTGGRLVLTE